MPNAERAQAAALFPSLAPTPPAKTPPHNTFHDEMIAGICHIHAHPKIKFPVGRNIQINRRKNLVRLLIDRIKLRNGSERPVIFEAAGNLLRKIKTHLHVRREFPSPPHIQPMQRAVERRIEIQIPASDFLVDDRPQLVIPAILGKLPPLLKNPLFTQPGAYFLKP